LLREIRGVVGRPVINDDDSSDTLRHERAHRASDRRCFVACGYQGRYIIVVQRRRGRISIQALDRTPRTPWCEEDDQPEA
jgi:hypothetical protein